MAISKYQKGQETVIVRLEDADGNMVNALKSNGGADIMLACVEREGTQDGFNEREVRPYIEADFCFPCEINHQRFSKLCDRKITFRLSCKLVTMRDVFVSLPGPYNSAAGTQRIRFEVPSFTKVTEEVIDSYDFDEQLANITPPDLA